VCSRSCGSPASGAGSSSGSSGALPVIGEGADPRIGVLGLDVGNRWASTRGGRLPRRPGLGEGSGRRPLPGGGLGRRVLEHRLGGRLVGGLRLWIERGLVREGPPWLGRLRGRRGSLRRQDHPRPREARSARPVPCRTPSSTEVSVSPAPGTAPSRRLNAPSPASPAPVREIVTLLSGHGTTRSTHASDSLPLSLNSSPDSACASPCRKTTRLLPDGASAAHGGISSPWVVACPASTRTRERPSPPLAATSEHTRSKNAWASWLPPTTRKRSPPTVRRGQVPGVGTQVTVLSVVLMRCSRPEAPADEGTASVR
jgi:hypothetical protein